MLCQTTAREAHPKYTIPYLEKVEHPERELKELSPSPYHKLIPQEINQVRLYGVLISGGVKRDNPRDDVALGGYHLAFEVFCEFRQEDAEQALELVHFDLENLELVHKQLVEVSVHHLLEDGVSLDFVTGFDEKVPCDVVHALAI